MFEADFENRDSLFGFIFGKNKEWALSLYNALNGSEYADTSSITLRAVSDAVCIGMKNDVSFLVSTTVSLYDDKSYNPNIPMRFFLYLGELYSKYIEYDYNLESSSLQMFPSPRCICFYNGDEEKDDRSELRLSSSFEDKKSDIEVAVTMINIKCGTNKDLLDRCQPLKDYSWLIDRINMNLKEMQEPEDAVDAALEEMPENFVVRKFLIANKVEVRKMCITEYNEARNLSLVKEEGCAEGRVEGRVEGRTEGTIKTLAEMIKKGRLTEAEAAEEAHMTISEFRESVRKYCSSEDKE